MIIRRHRNLVDTPGWKPLATIAYNTKLTALHGREVAMCVSPVYTRVSPVPVRVQRRTTCVCGLRRLTIRDAGIYGRAVFMPIVGTALPTRPIK